MKFKPLRSLHSLSVKPCFLTSNAEHLTFNFGPNTVSGDSVTLISFFMFSQSGTVPTCHGCYRHLGRVNSDGHCGGLVR